MKKALMAALMIAVSPPALASNTKKPASTTPMPASSCNGSSAPGMPPIQPLTIVRSRKANSILTNGYGVWKWRT